MLPRDPEPKPGTSGVNVGRKPGQPGFVNRGGRGEGGGANRNAGGYSLPSFSSDDTEPQDDDDDDNDNDNENIEEEMEVEEDDEVDFPKLGAKGQPLAQNIPLIKPKGPVAKKNINLIRAPRRGKSGLAEITRWNRMARQGVQNETKRGWMAKNEKAA